MELDTVAKIRRAFYRLVGTTADDAFLDEQGEATNEVAYLYLTRGCREAQQTLLDLGAEYWRKRSDALVWSGTDAADGGRYTTLPDDFLRAYGNEFDSCLRKANGDTWGIELDGGEFQKGQFYYFRDDDQLRLGRNAHPPIPVYLHYHYKHPEWADDLDPIDFPMDDRWLVVAEAANTAKEENWLPGGAEMEIKIDRALRIAKESARKRARRSKRPRQMRRPRRVGNHY